MVLPPPQQRNIDIPIPRQLQPMEAEEAQEQLTQAIVASSKPLAKATTVFPFTLFPDTIVVDRSKITITHRVFFWTAEVISIRVEDVLNVMADVGPLFGSVKIVTRFFNAEKPYTVNYLTRSDALRIKRILQGYVIATQKEIDCSNLDTWRLSKLLEELGSAGVSENV
ncbi:MAG TPA: hypothetical protein VIM53_00750 [Candidatus Saccharimonadales bacterium]